MIKINEYGRSCVAYVQDKIKILKTKMILLTTKITAIAVTNLNVSKVHFSYFVYKNKLTGRISLIVGKF